jgi:DNA-directed RNA polymerase specialized sigma24 family protein
MGTVVEHRPGDTIDPFEELRGGDRQTLANLFDRYRDRLRRMVEQRVDPRVRARLDASDVLQEAFLDVAGDLEPTWPTRSCRRCSGCGCTSAGD